MKAFIYTKNQINKLFSNEIVSKYGDVLCYLYQNGYKLNCENDEVEEQLAMFNFFQTEDDFEELKSLEHLESSYEIGKKIVLEEIYDIVKNNTFIRTELDNPMEIKKYADLYWNRIVETEDRIRELFVCKDLEVYGFISSLITYKKFLEKLDLLEEKIDKGLKVLTWTTFSEIMNNLYSLYIEYGKTKVDNHKITIASNLNDELYGGIGGFNPNTKTIKAIIGSAVYDVKSCKAGNKTKIKNMASSILKETKTDNDEKQIEFLDRWMKGFEKDDEYAQRVVVNCLLNGILTLLILKHNINFLEDNRNSKRADTLKQEFNAILKFCQVEKDYLF